MWVEVETLLGKGGSTRRMSRYEPSTSCESSLIYAIDFTDKLEYTTISLQTPKM